VLGPTVVYLGRLIVKKGCRHWHLLAIGLEAYGVTSGSNEAVDEDRCREVGLALAGLVLKCPLLNVHELVECVEERLLVT
jgi:hypothetical protein